MLKSEIINKAEKFCSEHNIDNYPVNIIGICNKLGIKVFEEYLPVNVSGFIMTDKNNFEKYDARKVIVVNLSDSPSRRRFTVSHELAHYILHKNKNDELFAHRDAGQNGVIEREANAFASNILMPENLVRKEIQRIKDFSSGFLLPFLKVRHIAEAFAVSEASAEVRLKELGII